MIVPVAVFCDVYKCLPLEMQIPVECWDLILLHVSSQQSGCPESREKVWMGTEGLYSLAIKRSCKNKGRLVFLAHHFYTGTPAKHPLASTAASYSCEDSLLSMVVLFRG